MKELIGQPLDRVDGPLKVSGHAKYSAEFQLPNLAHAVCVQSTVAKGHIRSLDAMQALAAPGVLAVLTHKNIPPLHELTGGGPSAGFMPGEKDLLPLQGSTIYYDGQHVAVVVAETFEQAEYAATLVKVDYALKSPVLEIEADQTYTPKQSNKRPLQINRGDPDQGLQAADVRVEETYTTPVLHHNPMEPHATIAAWNGDQLTLYDATQWVMGTRNGVADCLGVPRDKVRVVSLYVGGGFGCKGSLWAHPILAALAAQKTRRPVKLVLSRQQMFTSNGHRGRTVQRMALGATRDGRLTAVRHDTTTETSMVGEFIETCGLATRLLYACPNLAVTHKVGRLNVGTPTQMRAPGEATGTFAIECAMDELAYQLKIDPLTLRLNNYAELNPQDGKPWSSKHLRECYQRGAEAIGWFSRNPQPASMRQGDYLVGYGMATAIYPANRVQSSAKVQILADGRAVASSSTQDIGTGTYTIMTQIAAEMLGLPMERVEFKLGDSSLPQAPVSGGSQTAASVGAPVREAALMAKTKVIRLAIADKASPLNGQSAGAIAVENGRLFVASEPSKGETYSDILKRQSLALVEAESSTTVSTREAASEESNPATPASVGGSEGIDSSEGYSDKAIHNWAYQSFGAQFAIVHVDPLLGMVRVARAVSVMDIGRVLNAKTARNQILGGFVYGLGMALMEETVYDPNRGRIVTRDLANYRVPVNADMPEMEVQFIGEPDPHISPIGARGIGEIGTTGSAAAIANAVYHATGKRIRDLPITPDKLI